MARLVLEHVSKVFRGSRGEETPAVRDACLAIEDREFVVLVGPSGCGKTTLLRLLAGLESVTQGIIRIGDRVANEVKPEDRDLAMVFQHGALYPHLTIRENMLFGLKLRNVPVEERERRVREAASLLGLSRELERLPGTLSGGQRQRAALGRAVVRQPAALLLDEPLSNLDAPSRVELRREMATLHRRLGTTTLYVTHDQAEALTLGHRVAVMKDGMIQQVDSPLTLYHQPANVFVAGFIGSPPMNLITGRLLVQDGHLTFLAADPERRGRITFRLGADCDSFAVGQPMAGRDVVMGLRPEHFLETLATPGGLDGVTGVVEAVEPMGNETFVSLRTGPIVLSVRREAGFDARLGQHLTLAFNPRKARFFDPASGKALT